MARHKEAFNAPKIELHTHIGGCIRPTTFMELVESKGIDIEALDFYKVDIAMAFEFFKVTGKMISDLVILRRVVREMIEDYAN
jgi:adenosine deaminase